MYVTDKGMRGYLYCPNNGYGKLFAPSKGWRGVSKNFIESRPNTVLKKLEVDPFDLSIRSLSSFEAGSEDDPKFG